MATPHVWNFLYPRDPLRGIAHASSIGPSGIAAVADDLAYMIAQFWYPERRARLEQALCAHLS